MRIPTLSLLCLLSAPALLAQPPVAPAPATVAANESETITIPAGTKVPLALKHAMTTKSARVGDGVYLQSTFPVTINNEIVMPPGTYVQGVVDEIRRAGRIKGRAEVLFHFTTLIFPNGYTVSIPASIESVPGMDNSKVKDKEGTIQAEGQKGEDAATVAGTTATGSIIGALSNGAKGAGMGAGIGAAAGLATVLFTRGKDVRLESGTTVEMVFNRALALNAARLYGRSSQASAQSEPRVGKRPVLVPSPDPR